jgi:hypothetical protein
MAGRSRKPHSVAALDCGLAIGVAKINILQRKISRDTTMHVAIPSGFPTFTMFEASASRAVRGKVKILLYAIEN